MVAGMARQADFEETRVATLVVAGGKRMTLDARDLVLFAMCWLVDRAIDAGRRAFFAGDERLDH